MQTSIEEAGNMFEAAQPEQAVAMSKKRKFVLVQYGIFRSARTESFIHRDIAIMADILYGAQYIFSRYVVCCPQYSVADCNCSDLIIRVSGCGYRSKYIVPMTTPREHSPHHIPRCIPQGLYLFFSDSHFNPPLSCA